MALTTDQKSSKLFKKAMGVGETTTLRDFFEEPKKGLPSVLSNQIWVDAIPTTAPVLNDGEISGVVKRWVDKVLIAVPGTTNAFYHPDIINTIPFNYGDGSFNYLLKDSTGATIPFGQGDWILDTESGVLSFYGTVPPNMPPKLSCYIYVGTIGLGSSTGTSGYSGYSGLGISGYSGYSGLGISGYSGFGGYDGVSGYSGLDGISGYSGLDGVSGYSGYSADTSNLELQILDWILI
jgi:hypothetical protein